MLTAVSAFAGVGGFDLGLSSAGVRVTTAVEIDDAARGVLATHFPATALLSDIREVSGGRLREQGFTPGRGILAGGWPCQGHSAAGRRAGLADPRSGLFAELVRLAEELRPRWLMFENVRGLLSSGAGADMGRVLRALVGLGYGVAWRLFDARYFGIPQRRRRLILVGCLGDPASAEKVLFEPTGGGGDSAPRRPAGPQPARATAQGAAGCRGYGTSAADPDIAGPLGAPASGGYRCDLESVGAYVTGVLGEIAHTLTTQHDASEDGTGRGTPIVAYPVALRGRGPAGTQIEIGGPADPAYTLRSAAGGASSPMVAVGTLTASSGGQTEGNRLVAEDLTVRRLTPLECERLQGFPDEWTRVSGGRRQHDTARYRQIGNAVPPPLIAWCARRLRDVDAALGPAR